MRVGVVRLEAEGLLIMLDRLGQPALQSEGQAPVVVGVGVVRVDLQGPLEAVHSFGSLALVGQYTTEAVLSDGRVGVDGEGMSPERLGVAPDLDLFPGEHRQSEE